MPGLLRGARVSAGGLRRKESPVISSTDENSNEKKTIDTKPRQVTIFRGLVLVTLFVVAILCGSLSYIILSTWEESLYRSQFLAASNQLNRSISDTIEKFSNSGGELAAIAGMYHPNASTWPFVTIPKYYKFDVELNKVTGGTYSGVLPIVHADQVADFEAYAKSHIDSDPYISSFPQLYSTLGFGIYNYYNSGFQFTPVSKLNSSSEFYVPLYNVASVVLNDGILMYNMHDEPYNRAAMEACLDCVNNEALDSTRCTSMADFIFGKLVHSTILRPILPYNDLSEVVGFAAVGFDWEDELGKASVGLQSMNCVLSSPSQTHTISVEDGKSQYKGPGQVYSSKYSDMRRTYTLTLSDSSSEKSVSYVLTVYPTNRFRSDYKSNTPLYTCLASVSLIFFTSIIFFTYDYFVTEEDRAKQDLIRMKRDFVRFISHEIRTPLNTVSVGLKLMEDCITSNKCISKDELLDLNRDVQSGSAVAVSVLNDLLNFDKLEAGEFRVCEEPVKIWGLTESTVKSFSMIAYAKDIRMTCTFQNDDDCPISQNEIIVMGDNMKISHVLRNVISNALKFTEKDGFISVFLLWTPSVTSKCSTTFQRKISTKSRSFLSNSMSFKFQGRGKRNLESQEEEAPVFGKITIAVKDSGYGISEENLRLLFRDGMQFKANELQAGQGSGLGLYLSRKIVQMHGGRTWATSEGENKGSTFFVELPAYLSQFSQTDSRMSSTKDGMRSPKPDFNLTAGVDLPVDTVELCDTPASVSNKYVTPELSNVSKAGNCIKHVLVVDDTTSNRKMVCKILHNRGFVCTQAKDGKECISIMENSENKFDCILMDYEMPIMNGPTATRQLRAMGYTLPIIGLTGNVMHDDVHYFLDSGAEHVLSKPFCIERFFDAIAHEIEE